ncbi:hypothetical protein CRM22_007994 [Opisthorchis felineus]|uniref:Uncharacterized protein n=1 Tax=Opisthorchis felineus TaxID=147828 RepID=A0A4S2LDA8_OPIFE|nr:hypothetical protein CRM22_007994 [Opisthorchis felineus]
MPFALRFPRCFLVYCVRSFHRRYLGYHLNLLGKMPQKSLLSFFSNNVKMDEKPIPLSGSSNANPPNKRRRLIVDSDDSCDGIAQSIDIGECSKTLCGVSEPKVASRDSDNLLVDGVKADDDIKPGIPMIHDTRSECKENICTPSTSSPECKQKKRPAREAAKAEIMPVQIPCPSPASQTTLVYNPAKENYHPVQDAPWECGSSVPYLCLAKTFEFIESTSGRLFLLSFSNLDSGSR